MNRILCTVLLILCAASTGISQNNYSQLWEALNKGDQAKATSLMKEAIQNKSVTADQFITNIYLKAYEGREGDVTDFESSFYDKVSNPYPYIYALWFNQGVLGSYGKKTYPHQVKLMEKLLTDTKAQGTLVAATQYQKAMHLLSSNEIEDANTAFSKVGNIRNWQYAGPFENLSHSGFYKNAGPLTHPESNAEFLSITNAKVKWFSPTIEANVGWTPVCYQINRRTATVYAQTFVDAKEDQDILCNVGATGAVKVWMNDELILSEYKERVTELDSYTAKAQLKKGTNRILVQLSFTRSDFPNFIVRLTDSKFAPIPGLEGSNVYKPYNAVKESAAQPVLIPHFAEAFFKDKIATEPDNLVNYLLLSNVYMRSKKSLEARHVIETAMQKAPGNCLLRMKLIEVLIEEENRSMMLEEIEKLKKADPQSFIAMELDIKNDISNEKYDDASKKIVKREELYGEDETTLVYKISLLAKEKKYEDLVAAVLNGYKKYPQLESLLPMMYSIKKDINKDAKGALKVYESYLKNVFNSTVLKKYAKLLEEQGYNDKSMQQKQVLLKVAPYDPGELLSMSSYYYGVKQYDKSEQFVQKALELSPYNEYYWEQLGDIKSETKQTAEAIAAYEKSLLYEPNQYDVINKLRKLNGKSESYKLFSETDIDEVIKNDKPANAKNTDYGFYIIHEEKSVVMHPGGATEEYNLFMVKITNEKGIDKYKESSIGYSGSQELLIEKAEVIKASGAKIKGERNDNEIVFTNLEVGDVVVFKYRLQNYVYGRFAKEFWDKYHFGGQIYSAYAKYTVLMPEGQELKYFFSNGDLKPVIKQVENFKQYTWEMTALPPLKDEPLMPNNCDVAAVLHLSTLGAWNDIATWYQDLTSNTTEEDYEITSLFQTLLPAEQRKKLNQFEQARILYNYIEKNIRYSSVSFRQSAYVPQRASVTLNTRLGDCKDLSNLFLTLCRMAGIECQMVLVDTKDNGQKDMILPSLEFNHCITKVKLDSKDYYVELTDNYLPFASLPNSLTNALILEIPVRKTTAIADLKFLAGANKTKDYIKRKVEMKPVGTDMMVTVASVKYGNPSSTIRESYVNLDYDKQLIDMEKSVASSYKNNIKVTELKFQGLDQLSDSVTYQYTYKVKDEINEIGSMQTFKIAYPDVVASLNNFTADTRIYPIKYTNYEDVDVYETTVNVIAPTGKTFVELPANENLAFKNIKFSIDYKLANPGKLVVTRKFISDRQQIAAEDYLAFKSFFEKIIKAEQKMIAIK
jgi:transglutaminase-like putative cysteine protease/Tfp pilus assembly protein PilF